MYDEQHIASACPLHQVCHAGTLQADRCMSSMLRLDRFERRRGSTAVHGKQNALENFQHDILHKNWRAYERCEDDVYDCCDDLHGTDNALPTSCPVRL